MVSLAAVLAAGTGLKAQEVTVVLNPGWTWISYPSTDTVDFATALGSFNPEVGDVIKSRWGPATIWAMANGGAESLSSIQAMASCTIRIAPCLSC